MAPAVFGASLVGQLSAALVKAEPVSAATRLTNRAACKGAIVLVERGIVSFGTKAGNVQEAGAVAGRAAS